MGRSDLLRNACCGLDHMASRLSQKGSREAQRARDPSWIELRNSAFRNQRGAQGTWQRSDTETRFDQSKTG